MADSKSSAAPCPPAQAADDELVDTVLIASRALVAVAARSLAAAGDEVTLPQYRALVVLAAQGPQGTAELAAALAVNPSTATRMCDRLVRKGLVRRHRQAGDRRAVRIALTPAGRDLVTEVTRQRRAELARLLSALSPEEHKPVIAAFRAFAPAAGELPSPGGRARLGRPVSRPRRTEPPTSTPNALPPRSNPAAAQPVRMVPATRTSKSQLYHYFADKDALVLEVIRRQLDQVIAGQETELRELRTWEGPRRWRDHVVEGTRMTGGVGGCPLGWPSTWPSPTPGATAPADSLVTAARAPGSERATAAGRGLKVSRAGSGGFLDLAGPVAMVPGFVEDLDRGGGRNGSRCAA